MRTANACVSRSVSFSFVAKAIQFAGRAAVVAWFVCLSFGGAGVGSILVAQTPQPSSDGGGAGNANPGDNAAAPGGGVIADFDTLMNLIQQTIDPDSWLQAGGTNTISPYPSGVYVDPKGYMRRVKESGQLPVDLRLATPNRAQHPWLRSSKLRTISLKALDASIAQAQQTGLQPSIDLLELAGLSRITYVKVLPESEDVLIAGPTGEHEHGFLLQDLATVAAVISRATTPIGCSIDPRNEGILAAQQMLQESGAIQRLARNPKSVVERMQEKIGAHDITVFGLPANCSTAIALVDADEHMKRVAFGSVKTLPQVKTYFDFLDEQAAVPEQSLVRWWFAYSDEPIEANGALKMFQLPENCACVMSEQQWLTQTGQRAPTGKRDIAADKFAKEFSSKMPELRKSLPSYARLSAVFESGLALQLVLETNGEEDLAGWFPNLCAFGKRLCETKVPAAKSVEGLTAWHKLKSGTVVAVVSGGVKMDLQAASQRDKWTEAKFLAASTVPSQAEVPTTAHAKWWWD